MRLILFFAIALFLLPACQEEAINDSNSIIAFGQMPNAASDASGNLHLVYGSTDSILYSYSQDQGKTFSVPELVSIVPELAASHMTGPQIVGTSKGVAITACTKSGNIFSFTRDNSGKWLSTGRINDIDTVAKENLMALAADTDNVFAVWLDLRNKHNEIFGAKSVDGGRTWSMNIRIYVSPDTSVCECCKPSVAVKGNNVYVMFRNWVKGNRDLYLVQSADGGNSFDQAQKLGSGTWALNGCPMDGGALIVNKNGNPETVWNRKGVIYSCEPGKEELKLGEGRNCTMGSVNGRNIYAWVENGNIVVQKSPGVKENLGKGHLPVLATINNNHILCVWEKDKKIFRAVLEI